MSVVNNECVLISFGKHDNNRMSINTAYLKRDELTIGNEVKTNSLEAMTSMIKILCAALSSLTHSAHQKQLIKSHETHQMIIDMLNENFISTEFVDTSVKNEG